MRQKTAVHTLRLKAFFCSALRIDAFSFLLIYFKRYEIEKGYERRAHHHHTLGCYLKIQKKHYSKDEEGKEKFQV